MCYFFAERNRRRVAREQEAADREWWRRWEVEQREKTQKEKERKTRAAEKRGINWLTQPNHEEDDDSRPGKRKRTATQ
ncbi:MAG: hypothetical protein AAF471_09405 [Myxococcota bacterium]